MLPGNLAAVLIALVVAVCATSPWQLVPSRRAMSLERRSAWRRDVLPMSTAVLHYAESQYHPSSAAISLGAQEHRPILLLENFDHLLLGIVCHDIDRELGTKAIALDFMDDFAFEEALSQWTTFEEFILITAHESCNNLNDRGTWAVLGVVDDSAALRLTLVVEQVTLRDVVKSFAVRYDHTGARSWSAAESASLARRAEHIETHVFHGDFDPKLPARLPIFPPNLTLNNDIGQDVISYCADGASSDLQNVGFDLTCINCVMKTNVTVGFDLDVTISDACLTDFDASCLAFNAMAMNITIEEFQQYIDLEIFFSDTISKSMEYKVLELPVGPSLVVEELQLTIGPAIGIQVEFDIDISTRINFTYGAQGHIPGGAFASFDLVDGSGDFNPSFSAKGWEGSSVDQIPLRVNSGEFNITTDVAFIPFVELALEVENIGLALRLIQNVPEVITTAEVKTNVSRNCSPLGNTDYESFALAFTVASGMELSTIAELIFEKGSVGKNFPTLWNHTLWEHDVPFYPALGVNTSACFVLSHDTVNATANSSVSFPHLGARDAVPTGHPASTGVLLAAASAIPTFDVHGIEKYFDAHGKLPTGVNYLQLLKTTDFPKKMEDAVLKAAIAESGARAMGGCFSPKYWLFVSWVVGVIFHLA
ncbi:hypothetical protein PHLGIDRAFT_11390 [Phlebiopsis gigantea 11061_1 CR5-6]|uniref:DUF7029 domain-containing protein n=1 Tax=Phlebiopsis gigantea (strain 11061_1 CR5-6) TaxID=745531 RepID=A0A0C3PSH5_PHLG1|nr:hypothetical protein PHLGIDRAFT_11390 [Phlebiopsis gigantea 11061_1 CR5-6]